MPRLISFFQTQNSGIANHFRTKSVLKIQNPKPQTSTIKPDSNSNDRLVDVTKLIDMRKLKLLIRAGVEENPGPSSDEDLFMIADEEIV